MICCSFLGGKIGGLKLPMEIIHSICLIFSLSLTNEQVPVQSITSKH